MSYTRDQQLPASDGESPRHGNSLRSGLVLHLAVFALAILVLFLLNSSTRGPDGAWWVRWPIQLWSIAWGLHLWGVAVRSAVPESPRF